MISKELLGEVLGFSVIDVQEKLNKNRKYYVIHDVNRPFNRATKHINIHELAHKCKEWALNKDYILKTHSLKSHSICTVIRIIEESPYIDTIGIYNLPTEPEAIFKACEWILENAKR